MMVTSESDGLWLQLVMLCGRRMPEGGGGGNFHFISPIDFPQEPGPIRYIQPLYTVRRGDTGADTSMHKEFKVQAAFTIHVCIYCILINSVHVQYMQCSLFMYTNIFSIQVVSVHTTVLYIY